VHFRTALRSFERPREARAGEVGSIHPIASGLILALREHSGRTKHNNSERVRTGDLVFRTLIELIQCCLRFPSADLLVAKQSIFVQQDQYDRSDQRVPSAPLRTAQVTTQEAVGIRFRGALVLGGESGRAFSYLGVVQ